MEELRAERQIGGWRHFIGENEIRCGDLIEILQGDDWIAGRYEANLHPSLAEPTAFLEINERHSIPLTDGMPARVIKD